MSVVIRSQFKRAIQAGIADIEAEITEAGVEALRKVGETANRVIVGDFYKHDSDCGCPLFQAGILNAFAEHTDFAHEIGYDGGFWHRFDAHMQRVVPDGLFNGALVAIIED